MKKYGSWTFVLACSLSVSNAVACIDYGLDLKIGGKSALDHGAVLTMKEINRDGVRRSGFVVKHRDGELSEYFFKAEEKQWCFSNPESLVEKNRKLRCYKSVKIRECDRDEKNCVAYLYFQGEQVMLQKFESVNGIIQDLATSADIFIDFIPQVRANGNLALKAEARERSGKVLGSVVSEFNPRLNARAEVDSSQSASVNLSGGKSFLKPGQCKDVQEAVASTPSFEGVPSNSGRGSRSSN